MECVYCERGVGRYEVQRWSSVRMTDHDYRVPLEEGTAELIRCPLALGYHFVRPCGYGHTGECSDSCGATVREAA